MLSCVYLFRNFSADRHFDINARRRIDPSALHAFVRWADRALPAVHPQQAALSSPQQMDANILPQVDKHGERKRASKL